MEQRNEERAREIERRQQVAEGLRDILAILNSNRSLQEILEYIVAQSGQLLDSDASLIYRFEQDRQKMVMEAEYGLPPDYKGLKSDLAYPTQIAQAALNHQPAAISDLQTYTASGLGENPGLAAFHREWFETAAQHFRSALGVPLAVRGELYGELVFYYCERREFSSEDFRLAVSIGDYAVLAIENARLRAQAEQVAVVKERERLARELHDSVTQSLYSLTLLSEAGRRLVKAKDLKRVEEVLIRLGGVSQQALKEMRLLVYELRPLVLKREGLVGALQHRLDAVEKRAGIEARLLTEGEIKLPMAVEQELYHIAQEALNNALKHAEASNVTVRIEVKGDRVELEVVDDGKGLNLDTASVDGGLGLISMQERAEKMGGTLEILSSPDKGTSVKVSAEGITPES
jgi:signal transduction histidine kinase